MAKLIESAIHESFFVFSLWKRLGSIILFALLNIPLSVSFTSGFDPFLLILSCFCSMFSIGFELYVWKKFVITDETLEMKYGFFEKKIRHDELIGWSMINTRGDNAVRFYKEDLFFIHVELGRQTEQIINGYRNEIGSEIKDKFFKRIYNEPLVIDYASMKENAGLLLTVIIGLPVLFFGMTAGALLSGSAPRDMVVSFVLCVASIFSSILTLVLGLKRTRVVLSDSKIGSYEKGKLVEIELQKIIGIVKDNKKIEETIKITGEDKTLIIPKNSIKYHGFFEFIETRRRENGTIKP